jgi:hypothetical protein
VRAASALVWNTINHKEQADGKLRENLRYRDIGSATVTTVGGHLGISIRLLKHKPCQRRRNEFPRYRSCRFKDNLSQSHAKKRWL